MNRFLICGIAMLIACSCNNSKVKIEGRLIGAESSKLYLESVSSGAQSSIIDSAVISDEGRFKVSFEANADDPTLYNIVNGGERIPLFLKRGDRVSISSMGSVAIGYRVEGSQESEILRQFYQPYIKGVSALDAIAQKYASPRLSEEQRMELARSYAKEYQSIKQTQLRFIIENQSKMAAVYALYQRLPGDQYLFNGDNDVIYLRTVADALEQSYPNSAYLKTLRSSISQMESSLELKSKISRSNFPDLEMQDMYGNTINLSSLVGRVILLEFWSSELGNSNAQNAELKEIYKEYRDQGFEIYQVGIDSSKSHWISTVQEQRLPWISVSDLKGSNSPSLGVYNVSKIPSNFLIGRDGTVEARDLEGEELRSRLKELL